MLFEEYTSEFDIEKGLKYYQERERMRETIHEEEVYRTYVALLTFAAVSSIVGMALIVNSFTMESAVLFLNLAIVECAAVLVCAALFYRLLVLDMI